MNTNYAWGFILAASLVGCGSLPHYDLPKGQPMEQTAPVLPITEWSDKDTVAQVAYYVMHGADWRTTMDIRRHPNLAEGNKILGKHPTNGLINTYFLGTAVIHYAVSEALPPEIRPVWQWTTFLIELKYVLGNLAVALSIL